MMRLTSRSLMFILLAIAGAICIGLASAMRPASAFGDDTALVMGPSGLPVPPPSYVDAANDLYIQPLHPGFTPQPLFTPEGFYSWTGVKELPIDTSVAQGVTILDSTVTNQVAAGNDVVVFGYSQSAGVSSVAMSDLAADGVKPSDVAFVLTGDVSAPNGGLLGRFDGLSLPSIGLTFGGATPGDLFPTTIYTQEYDGWADFPQYPINLLADLNAVAGMLYVHPHYLNLTPDQLKSVADGGQAIQLPTEGPTDTTYYMIPVENLPLLDPLRAIPVVGNPLADLLQPDLRVLVNLGYGNPDFGWSQGPANVPTEFGLFPSVDPATVVQDLATGGRQGVQNFMTDLTHPALSSLSPSSVTELLSALSSASPSGITQSFTDIVNNFSAALSSAYSTLLPTADIVNALLTSIPAYDVSLFVEGIEHGNLLAAIGDPIAANNGLTSVLGGLEIFTIMEAFGFTGLIP